MRAAFVAAPLIGTVIFLSSLLFVVNLSKYETSQVSYTVSDAYHNRIASLLEMYRSDMASVFSVGLSRAIEKFLLGQCWTSPPFGIVIDAKEWNSFSDASKCPDMTSQEECQRYQFCDQLTTLVQSSVCTINPNYGIKNWLSYMNDSITFEGISFEPANPEQFKGLTDPGTPYTLECSEFQYDNCPNAYCTWDGTACTGGSYTVSGNEVCSQSLISAKTFDCKAFGRNELKCLEDENGNELPGCKSGVFYVKVNVQNDAVYPSVPRVRASDGAGNVVRSGALSDQNFYVPVNLPLFRYYDMAYAYVKAMLLQLQEGYCIGSADDCAASNAGRAGVEAYRQLYLETVGATGVTGTSNVVTSSTSATGRQPELAVNPNFIGRSNTGSESAVASTYEAAKDAIRETASAKLVVKTLMPQIQAVESSFPGLRIEVSSSTQSDDLLGRKTFVASYNLDSDRGVGVADYLQNSFKDSCAGDSCDKGVGVGWRVGAYLSNLFLPSRIVDDSPVYRANPERPNDFCFTPNWITKAGS